MLIEHKSIFEQRLQYCFIGVIIGISQKLKHNSNCPLLNIIVNIFLNLYLWCVKKKKRIIHLLSVFGFILFRCDKTVVKHTEKLYLKAKSFHNQIDILSVYPNQLYPTQVRIK